ncbi:MAG: DUF1289 domain-containing protein [Methyloprofundus sp.]|nr:DUF1289 domain-containing protein [Methyloprofundus sp.]
MLSTTMQLENNTLYYIYDPMCSWCYAFEQVLSDLLQYMPAELTFKPILGGLAADTKTPMPIETQSMIQNAWRQIENTVPNVRFNFDFWTNNTAYRSTYPACRAILAATNQSAKFADSMRQAIQQTYYQEAKNPSLNEVLIDCAKQLPLDIYQFSKDLLSPAINNKLDAHRQFSRLLGVSSYPSLRLALNSEPYTISVDYTSSAPILEQINKLLGSLKQESPCIRNCCLNEEDVCLGCFRLLDEITGWAYTSEAEKLKILSHAAQRKSIYNKNLI